MPTVRLPPLRRCRELRSADPPGQGLPVRIVFGAELPASGMERNAAPLGRERLHQQEARGRIAGIDQSRDILEVATRLLLGPETRAGRQLLQPESIVTLRMADITSGMAGALLQE